MSCMLTSRTASLPISIFVDQPSFSFCTSLKCWQAGALEVKASSLQAFIPNPGKPSSQPAVEQDGRWSNRLREHSGEQIYGFLPFIIEGPKYLQRRNSMDECGGKELVRVPAFKVNSRGLLNWVFTLRWLMHMHLCWGKVWWWRLWGTNYLPAQ